MSLRFERKTTNRLRSTFSCRSRAERDGLQSVQNSGSNSGGGEQSWSFRQANFACDYLNLMDPPKPTLLENSDKMPPILREKSSALRSLPVPGPKIPDADVLHISEENLYHCDSSSSSSGGVKTKALPPILTNGAGSSGTNKGSTASKERCVSFNFNVNSANTMTIKRRGSVASVNSSNMSSTFSSYAASTVSSSSLSSYGGGSSLYEDLRELGLGEYGLDFKDLVSEKFILAS
jgi:hypothetical protein